MESDARLWVAPADTPITAAMSDWSEVKGVSDVTWSVDPGSDADHDHLTASITYGPFRRTFAVPAMHAETIRLLMGSPRRYPGLEAVTGVVDRFLDSIGTTAWGRVRPWSLPAPPPAVRPRYVPALSWVERWGTRVCEDSAVPPGTMALFRGPWDSTPYVVTGL